MLRSALPALLVASALLFPAGLAQAAPCANGYKPKGDACVKMNKREVCLENAMITYRDAKRACKTKVSIAARALCLQQAQAAYDNSQAKCAYVPPI
ncbi:MAG: hypothetical protein U1E15_11350 [Hyphomicrobiales bacterium]